MKGGPKIDLCRKVVTMGVYMVKPSLGSVSQNSEAKQNTAVLDSVPSDSGR